MRTTNTFSNNKNQLGRLLYFDSCRHHSHNGNHNSNNAKQAFAQARDAKRIEEASNFVKALDEYYVTNSAYPWANQSQGVLSYNCNQWRNTMGGFLSPFLSSIPCDPSNNQSFGSDSYRYAYYGSALLNECTSRTNTKAQACFFYFFETSNQALAKSECIGYLNFNYSSTARFECYIPLE